MLLLPCAAAFFFRVCHGLGVGATALHVRRHLDPVILLILLRILSCFFVSKFSFSSVFFFSSITCTSPSPLVSSVRHLSSPPRTRPARPVPVLTSSKPLDTSCSLVLCARVPSGCSSSLKRTFLSCSCSLCETFSPILLDHLSDPTFHVLHLSFVHPVNFWIVARKPSSLCSPSTSLPSKMHVIISWIASSTCSGSGLFALAARLSSALLFLSVCFPPPRLLLSTATVLPPSIPQLFNSLLLRTALLSHVTYTSRLPQHAVRNAHHNVTDCVARWHIRRERLGPSTLTKIFTVLWFWLPSSSCLRCCVLGFAVLLTVTSSTVSWSTSSAFCFPPSSTTSSLSHPPFSPFSLSSSFSGTTCLAGCCCCLSAVQVQVVRRSHFATGTSRSSMFSKCDGQINWDSPGALRIINLPP